MKMGDRIKSGHIIIVTAIFASLIATFFMSNTITGFTVAKESIAKGDFASLTGAVIQNVNTEQAKGFLIAVRTVLLGLFAIAILVVVARVGQNTLSDAKKRAAGRTPNIKDAVKKAEKAVDEGKHADAYSLYTAARELYAQLSNEEKSQYYSRIMHIHGELAHQAAMAEAHYLTEKYVNSTITEEEFERLKQIIASQ